MKNYKNNNNSRRQSGFGLLEVTVATLVLVVGLTALVRLQINVLRSSNSARNHSVAVAVAQGQLERMRASHGLPELGRGPSGDSSVALSGTTFSLDWAVTPAPDTLHIDPRMRHVSVTVSWPEPNGEQGHITLDSQISQRAIGSLRTGSSAQAHPRPVIQVPESLLSLQSIDLGDGLTKASLVVDVGGQSASDSSVTVLRDYLFQLADADRNEKTQRVVAAQEFATVGCVCRLDTANGEGANTGFSPARYDTAAGTFRAGVPVPGKQIGQRASGRQAAGGETADPDRQSPLCDICCRDHHDLPRSASADTDQVPSYVPQSERPATAAHAAHRHYFADADGRLQIARNHGEAYLESCRLVRIDGLWRVAQDWNFFTQNLLPANSSAAALQRYGEEVTAAVRAQLLAIGDSDANSAITPVASTVAADSIALNLAPPDNRRILQSRAIHVEALDHANSILAACQLATERESSDRCANRLAVEPSAMLPWPPFVELNTSRQADWRALPDDAVALRPGGGKSHPNTHVVASAIGSSRKDDSADGIRASLGPGNDAVSPGMPIRPVTGRLESSLDFTVEF